jgi:hypothetical protein
MRISTFGQFFSFIISKDFKTSNIRFVEFISHVQKYNETCNCKEHTKKALHTKCNQEYISIVKEILPLYKGAIFSTIPDSSIEFYHSHDFLINTMHR